MSKLDKSEEPYAKVALAVYTMLFKITEASFWIAGKDFTYDRSWMAFEVAALMRKVPTTGVRLSERSAHEYWRIRDISVIAIALKSLDALAFEFTKPPQDSITTSAASV
jgi:hypothetical protein